MAPSKRALETYTQRHRAPQTLRADDQTNGAVVSRLKSAATALGTPMVATQTAWSMQPWCPLRKSDAARIAASCQDSIRPRTKARGFGRGASESHRSARRTRASSANSSGHSSSGSQRGYSVEGRGRVAGVLCGKGSGIPVPSCSNRSRRRQLPGRRPNWQSVSEFSGHVVHGCPDIFLSEGGETPPGTM